MMVSRLSATDVVEANNNAEMIQQTAERCLGQGIMFARSVKPFLGAENFEMHKKERKKEAGARRGKKGVLAASLFSAQGCEVYSG